jgi:hypothetical protein
LVKKGEDFETREVKIGASNEKMVTITDELKEGEVVVLNPRSHLDRMKLPEIEEVDDREKLQEIGKTAPPQAKGAAPPGAAGGQAAGGKAAGGQGAGGQGAGGQAAGGQGGGRGGPGGGELSAAKMVESTMERADTNKDGELTSEEIDTLDARFKDSVKQADTNGDGKVNKAELTVAMGKVVARIKSMMGGAGGGGPPGGGGGGPR